MGVPPAVLAGMVWARENPTAGIVEADELDFRRCLEIQMPYLGPVKGVYTDWTPLTDRPRLFPEDIDETDPWQFRTVLVRPEALPPLLPSFVLPGRPARPNPRFATHPPETPPCTHP